MYEIIICSDPKIYIYNNEKKTIDNTFDSYESAIDWVNKNFKKNKYLSFNIIEVK